MTDSDPSSPALNYSGHHRLRLETLVRLRWLAVAGQSAGVLVVAFGLNYDLPLAACFTLIAMSAWLNVFLLVRFPATLRLRSQFSAAQLAYDSLQLGGLLYLTGGLYNPFALLLLAPVSVSATTLPYRWTLAISGLAIAIITVLGFFHMPLPWGSNEPFVINNLYVFGIWAALVCGVVFTATYTNRVAHEARQLADALSATELVLAREQHLSAIDGLATAAAHELGTPLATIALAAKEMQTDLDDPQSLKKDLELITEQATRCREILQKLRNLNTQEAHFAELSASDLVAEVSEPQRFFGIDIDLDASGDGVEPKMARNSGLIYGLGNLIENAVDFAQSRVEVKVRWTAKMLEITICDDGPGFTQDMLMRMGEPYLTTRPKDNKDSDPTEPGGLGLGIFIAKTLLERTGAQLDFYNRDEGQHACVKIAWPRQVIELSE
ncbi:ActS/PrrB/RegB family redox-sensitive histidine kinase [Maritalea mediterranea]|uniref:histidine kinase n=1 Tax=Maritalea mediterranea TaxID=2909667 RepID=A0ABS9E2G1_9HYPH|nr:ActS/PrrB/RegB family redox-sensitive histidine kinase [Maritalea mediterranea]